MTQPLTALKIKAKNKNELLLTCGEATARIRYFEVERIKEDFEGEEWEADMQHDRVTAELHLMLPVAQGDIPPEKWVRLVQTYCRDSYDDMFELVLESDTIWATLDTLVGYLDLSASASELLDKLAGHTPYAEGFRLIVNDEWAWTDDPDRPPLSVVE